MTYDELRSARNWCQRAASRLNERWTSGTTLTPLVRALRRCGYWPGPDAFELECRYSQLPSKDSDPSRVSRKVDARHGSAPSAVPCSGANPTSTIASGPFAVFVSDGFVMSGGAPAYQGLFFGVALVVGAVMSSASHEGSSVNRFLPMPIRGELSFPQGSPANLTSGGITIPATVPHSGRESFEGTAPLCKDGARRHAEDRRRSLRSPDCAARFRRRLDGGLHNCTLRHHTINDKSP
jgi:hypothetical protein